MYILCETFKLNILLHLQLVYFPPCVSGLQGALPLSSDSHLPSGDALRLGSCGVGRCSPGLGCASDAGGFDGWAEESDHAPMPRRASDGLVLVWLEGGFE